MKMLGWMKQFSIFCFLDNAQYPQQRNGYECMAGAGALSSVTATTLSDMDFFLKTHKEWVFGHLCYDLKEILYGKGSFKQDKIQFPFYHFFVPEVLLLLQKNTLVIRAKDPDSIFVAINKIRQLPPQENGKVHIRQRLEKAHYLQAILNIKNHILRGDCYELNYCQEFFAEDLVLEPVDVFLRLTELSPNPFSALYRLQNSYLICASPERYLMKQGNRIIGQPMKGTIKRDVTNAEEDSKLKEELSRSAKDRSENVMIADLMRNDLSRICKKGSVKADELFGVYSYPQVHQMISTISGLLKDDIPFSAILKATFPMGSMTGAPKKKVMELIDQYEITARGIFSGSLGYFNPEGDFDFNVVIRSIMYNSATRYLSYQAGSGITFYSEPEKEWEECMLKAEAIRKVLTN